MRWHPGNQGGSMARIPTHTIEDAPAVARPLLAEMIQFSPTGRLVNMHAQLAIISTLALRSGWQPDQVEALLAGQDTGEDRLDALTGVIREAAANSGRVSDTTWNNAAGQGWDDEQLTEAFAYLGLTAFTSYFLNYAATELDVPAPLAHTGQGA
jgi:hypothetical protein